MLTCLFWTVVECDDKTEFEFEGHVWWSVIAVLYQWYSKWE